MSIKWNIRMMMAHKGIWTGVELRKRLREEANLNISPSGITRLLKEDQKEIKLRVLSALCTVLSCPPEQLLILEKKNLSKSVPRKATAKKR